MPKRNPYTLWFVILSFIAPVVAAYAIFFFGEVTSFNNNGEFIKPMIEFSQLGVKTADDEVFLAESLDNKWHMLMVNDGHCDNVCKTRMIDMRQINKAVKRSYKIRHIVVSTGADDKAMQAFMQDEMSTTIRLNTDAASIDKSLSITTDVDPNTIYLVDPLGYVMMKFRSDVEPKLVIKDLNRLF